MSLLSDEDSIVLVEDMPDLSSVQIICSKCSGNIAQNDSVTYYSPPRDLKAYLQMSLEGKLILFHYEKYGHLSKGKQDSLCDLLIDRELLSLLDKEHVSLANPLKRVK